MPQANAKVDKEAATAPATPGRSKANASAGATRTARGRRGRENTRAKTFFIGGAP